MIDENDFFRKITLKICGNLKIEEGLRDCIRYLAEFMPADRIYLERHDHGPGEMRPLARANVDQCEKLDMLIKLSPKAKATAKSRRKQIRAGTLPRVFVHNDPKNEPFVGSFLKALGEPQSSVLWLPLILEKEHTGALILLAHGKNRFKEHHAQLFTILREPFFVAMSNAMKHERVVEDNRELRSELINVSGENIIGVDFGLKNIMKQIQKVCPDRKCSSADRRNRGGQRSYRKRYTPGISAQQRPIYPG